MCFFRVNWLQPAMKAISSVRRLRLGSFGSFYVFCNNACSCVRRSMHFLTAVVPDRIGMAACCCMGFVLGRKPEHETVRFSV